MNWKQLFFGIVLVPMLSLSINFYQVKAEQKPTYIDALYAPMYFQFDGKYFAPPEGQRGFIYKGRTYVPLRFLAYSLNKAVQWEESTYTVTVREPNRTESITIGEYRMNREQRDANPEKFDSNSMQATTISVYFDEVQYVFDGEVKQPPEDLPGMIYQDTLYVPMRFISESVGMDIQWDPDTLTVIANKEQDLLSAADEVKTRNPTAPVLPPVTSIPRGGGVIAKPTSESLVAQAQANLNALKSDAESSLSSLLSQYQAAQTDSEKASIIIAGWNELSRIESQYQGIVSTLRVALIANNYDTAIIQTIEEQYQSLKSAEMQKLKTSIKSSY